MTARLFEPFTSQYLGALKNRIVMTAMTRNFADAAHCATQAMKEYYAKRSAGGVALILTEGVIIHPTGDGYNDVPHIANAKQADSWRPVVQAVHEHGSRILCQLWHCGRISHSDYTSGVPPVSSTAVAATGINRQNNKPYGVPVALTTEGIAQVHVYYMDAIARALDAGFDGVELHLGHGYLADQFFDARINDRTDEYGGSVENRCRFSTELVAKVMAKFDHDKIALRISPSRDMGGIYDWPDLPEMLAYLLPEFWRIGVRVLDISCARADYFQTSGRVIRLARPLWKGEILGGASLSVEQAERELEDGLLDMVTWGRFLIANPDFVERVQRGAALADFSPAMLGELV